MAQSSSQRPVVISLYRACLRWTKREIVCETKFYAGDVPPSLASLGLSTEQLSNSEGIREAIRTTFRAKADLTEEKLISAQLDVGFEALQYLNHLTRFLEQAKARREQSERREGISFKIGQVVRHKQFNYRGVIIGWDRRPTVDVSNWEGVITTESGENQPFYHVTPDASDVTHFLGGPRRLMYCAQENLELLSPLESRVHSEVISHSFQYYDPATNAFVPHERIAYQYPADVIVKKGGKRRGSASIQQAKLVDASRRVERGIRKVAAKLWAGFQTEYGDLNAFGEPIRGLIKLLSKIKEPPSTHISSAASSSVASSSSTATTPSSSSTSNCSSSSSSSTTSKGSITSNLPAIKPIMDIQPGYDALRALKDLFAHSDDLLLRRIMSRDRQGVEFSVGQVVRHKVLGYRGLIAGWERFPRIPLPSDPPSLIHRHPHYRIIVNEKDNDISTPTSALVVLPQETLEEVALDECSTMHSPLIPESFTHFDPMMGRFHPNETLMFKFPADIQSSSLSPSPASSSTPPSSKHEDTAEAHKEKIIAHVFKVLLRLLNRLSKPAEVQSFKGDLLMMLKHSRRKEDADVVENIVWSSWLAHPDETVRILMDDGTNLMMRGKYDEAIARFDLIIKTDETFAEAYNKRATAHFLAGRHRESLKDVIRTLDLEPDHFGASTGKGLSLYHLEKFEEAVKAFKATLSIHPWSSNVGTTLYHTVKQAAK